MKKKLLVLLTGTFSLFLYGQDLQTVLEKNDRAIGLDARKEIRYLQTKGYFTMNDSEAKIPFKVLQARPDKMRIESSVFGLKTIQTYNGNEAWMLNPAMGLEAQKTDTDDFMAVALATALDGPFRYQRGIGGGARFAGRDEYLGKEVFTVITGETASSRLKFYIDAGNYLVNGVRFEYEKNGGWYSMEYRIGSYTEKLGAMFPAKITARINGVEMTTIHVEEVRRMDHLDPGLFGKPSF